jgi:lysophospholipase L1-like esterase
MLATTAYHAVQCRHMQIKPIIDKLFAGRREIFWKRCLVTATVIFLVAVYLNRSYANIYDTVGTVGLKPPVRADFYETQGAPGTKPLRLAFIGDSLTAGVGVPKFAEAFPYQVAAMMAKETPIHLTTHAMPGYKTAEALRDLVPLTLRDEADVAFVFIGVNDIHGQTRLADFRRDYEAILVALSARPDLRLYAVTVPKIGSPYLLYPPYNWYFHWRTDRFNDVIAELAQAHGAILIDLAALTADQLAATDNAYAADEFHPSAAGYSYWAAAIYASYHR